MTQAGGDSTIDSALEAVLEPGLPIVDPHHHLFPEPPTPDWPVYGPQDLLSDIEAGGHHVLATVLTDSHAGYETTGPEHLRRVGETRYAHAIAEQSLRAGGVQLCAGIVASADLTMGERAGEVLDAHMAASPRFRGVRHMTAYDAEVPVLANARAGVTASPEFGRGLAELARRGLSFDAWLFHTQLGELTQALRAVPELTVVLNHIASPLGVGRFAGRRDEVFADWRRGMAELARMPQVVVKIGGLNLDFVEMRAGAMQKPLHSAAVDERQRDYVLTVIDLFGPARCMFESNFPVEKVGISYRLLWNAFKRMTGGFSPAERRELFAGTAIRAYRLDVALPAV